VSFSRVARKYRARKCRVTNFSVFSLLQVFLLIISIFYKFPFSYENNIEICKSERMYYVERHHLQTAVPSVKFWIRHRI
jgi:hypothetical protein